MKKIKFDCLSLLDKFTYHTSLKDKILSSINNSFSEQATDKDNNVNRLDWSQNANPKREWVNILLKPLQEHFNNCAKVLNYKSCNIKNIWYQQYIKNNIHNWHIHSDNYTGVYYLEFDNEKASKTEILDNNLNINQVEAKEGDIIIFPSFLIHRSPIIKNDTRKTIISFNLEFIGINSDINKSKLKTRNI